MPIEYFIFYFSNHIMHLKAVFTLLVLFFGFSAACAILYFYYTVCINDNAYRSRDNKYYWGNRMPDDSYWEQDVQYKMFAKMREESNMIEGAEELTYWNKFTGYIDLCILPFVPECIY